MDGTYAKSGNEFGKNGKVWTNIGNVKNHLLCCDLDTIIRYGENCEIVTTDMKTKQFSSEPMKNLLKDYYIPKFRTNPNFYSSDKIYQMKMRDYLDRLEKS